MLLTPQVQAILAFGAGAHHVASLWPGSSGKFVAQLTHPSARNDAALLANWNASLPQLQTLVTADPGGTKDPESIWDEVQDHRLSTDPSSRSALCHAHVARERR